MPVVLPKYLEEMMKVLPKPESIWKYMLAVTQIPRGSNGEGEHFRHLKITSFLKERAEELNCQTYIDKGENLIIRKAAFPGCEDKPTVCLQCHMDMVVEKNDDVVIDFEKDPLTPRIVDGKWLMASGTSLGADNGIGIATCFAILEDNSIQHGPLEVLITRDEETGMFGATDLEEGILKAKYLINVDSEEENSICIGCAGGFTVNMTLPTPRESFPDSTPLTLTLNGFVGGHTGCDIDLGRANPLHVISRLLSAVHDDYRVIAIQCGTADNAIPRKCVVSVAVATSQLDSFKKGIESAFDCFKKEYHQIEKDATLTISDDSEARLPISKEATMQFVNFLNVCPFAVQRYSPVVKNAVETSMTCAIAKTLESSISFVASVRSSSSTQMDMMYNKLKCVVEMAGMSISEKKDPYPSWSPKADSFLTKAMVKAYEDLEHITPKVYAIHAGLECGLLETKYPEIECVSIGPELQSPHSPCERLLIESVPRYYSVLLAALKTLSIILLMSTDYPKLFRFCDLGSSLSDVLKEMVEEKKLSSAQMESILKCYDKEICGELERRQNELPKAHISADVDYYKRFFNTWSFFLTNCILDMNSKECVAEAHAKFFSTLATKE